MRWGNEVWPRKPEPGFHPGIYRDSFMDKQKIGDPYVNYIKNNRPVGKWKQALITRESIVDNKKLDLKVGIHIHVYYADLVYEILEAINMNHIKPIIHITYSGETNENTIKNIFRSHGMEYGSLTQVPNKGRDIGPLITELSHYMESKYEFYGHFHTKKSISISNEEGIKWRKFLIKNLLGHNGISMADKFLPKWCNEKLGIVFPEDNHCVSWGNNYENAIELAKKMGISSIPRSINFPVGNMFWVRKGVLKDLYDLNLGWSDYPLEPIEYDGTILHAIERLLPVISENNGYHYKMTYVSGVSR